MISYMFTVQLPTCRKHTTRCLYHRSYILQILYPPVRSYSQTCQRRLDDLQVQQQHTSTTYLVSSLTVRELAFHQL